MQTVDDTITLSPSDLSAFLACRHLTTLQLAVAHHDREKPEPNADALLVREKGQEHEDAHLALLERDGKTVRRIETSQSWAGACADTRAALEDGVDVVYQATFDDGRWRGRADFVLRHERASDLGDWSYEVLDTKLARHAKPSHILQLLFYDSAIAKIQGDVEGRRIHVKLGNGELDSYRPDEFAAYYRRVRARLEEFVSAAPETEPYPTSHCSICDFKPDCDRWWHDRDHLTLVAGMRRPWYDKLVAADLSTLTALAEARAEPRPAGLSEDVWEKVRAQARLQLAYRRDDSEPLHELLEPRAEAGLALLPEPSAGDLFFDFEGNPFWDSEGSLEYLWGTLDAEGNFDALHAFTRDEERACFEQFIDRVHQRLERHPDMHVYHYAQYEITALKRMMGRFGTRENELDDLLRRGVFVDLFKVVRNGVRCSVPSYGLKEMEVFLPLVRAAEVKDGGTSIVYVEQYLQTKEPALLQKIDAYNEEDCVATRELRDWLLHRRNESVATYGPFPQPEENDHKPRPERPEDAIRNKLRNDLLEGDEPLAAALLHYHDRERKPVWWAYYDRIEQTPEQLVDDADSIGCLELVGEPEQVTKFSKAYTFTWPPQEHKIRRGTRVFDPETRRPAGEIIELDREARRLVLKRGPKLKDIALPRAVIPGRPYDTTAQEEALARFCRSILDRTGRYPALETILRRDTFDADVQTSDLDELKALVLGLDARHLVIQGPPGSGKTWTSGRLIAHLLANRKTVAVASTSHQAIHKLLDEVEDAAAEDKVTYVGKKKASDNPDSVYESRCIVSVGSNDDVVDCQLAGGTAWLFGDECQDAKYEYLFIDEAGQVSLADAIAMGTCARNVVLVGDPQQLDQVLQGTHPERSERSVLRHLLGDDETVATNRGVFLERTFRLRPDVCEFISDEFYEGRLRPDSSAEQWTTPIGTGLRHTPVHHSGRKQESPEEVARVREIVDDLVRAGLPLEEIVVVAPYNAQVNALGEALPERARVGTVDKFQGQEGTAVVYSLTSSSAADVPRGLGFLLSRNRFNVAVSRARALAVLVCSPELLEVDCSTIEHMRLANALCRFVESASDARSGAS